ncbi:2-C-methyl-D-erythritol 4-phosphate cytidylyltransferase [Marinospirillum insulare]|uniref:2-C-methyl-D-erythritol 4-phosphate cytidylyltransferase n=1 Tax=Marinospirillum insulare TaxID=217169 RepID=A0ABQ5ZWL8_9GAMM|nr:2-C-methyl-D-erythritol 4-phosphate cytidylyltransferase [Marinospirillum insulare]GLR63713.1 2-C-methyl-D-erythritol 4-phosphate cytidylyltransferase [Marinospirillum insulare]
MTNNTCLWCVLPAAGIGERMGADLPKQYLPLLDQTLLEVTLGRIHQAFPEAYLVLPLHQEDLWWPAVELRFLKRYPQAKLITCFGGKERADSVLNGLNALTALAHPHDWVLVHDVARPCITQLDLQQLVTGVKNHLVGGLLAAPVADTMKRGMSVNNSHQVSATLDRNHLWHALTPQMFRYEKLHTALTQGLEKGLKLTDESSALEAAGYQPLLIPGRRDNIKITHPEDLALAELLLTHQQTTTQTTREK